MILIVLVPRVERPVSSHCYVANILQHPSTNAPLFGTGRLPFDLVQEKELFMQNLWHTIKSSAHQLASVTSIACAQGSFFVLNLIHFNSSMLLFLQIV